MITNKYVVSYDICNQKRLNKAAKIILDYGIRVQKSVYEVELNSAQFTELCRRLSSIIKAEEDGVKLFKLCEVCTNKRISIGVDVPQLEPLPPWQII